MKILIISDAWKPQINGVVRTYECLIDELIPMGHEIKVIGPHDFPFRAPMLGYKEIEMPLNPHFRLRKLIGEFQPESFHIATEGPLGQSGRRYCLKHNIPFTTCYHTHFPDYISKRVEKFAPSLASPIKKLATDRMNKFHRDAYAMMVATQSLEDELKSWGFKVPMHRLTRGAQIDLFRPGEQELFNDLKRPVALYVGRVAIEKNLEDFLSMDWHGSKVVVGLGPSLAMFQRKYPDVRFVGNKTGEELATHYRSADVFVFPSRTDTFGMVLIEALASGLPVAAYDVTGPRDIITAPYLGCLHEDLALAARKALEHGALAEVRHAHVRDNYTWKIAAQQFEDIQKQVRITAIKRTSKIFKDRSE